MRGVQQDALFEMASRETDVDVVVVLNSDIMLGDDFVDALEFTEQKFDRFLLIGARYDSLEIEDIPRVRSPRHFHEFVGPATSCPAPPAAAARGHARLIGRLHHRSAFAEVRFIV